MKSETAVVPLTPVRPKASAAWKAVLGLIPLVTVVLLLWLRQVQVQQLASRPLPVYGSVPAFEMTDQEGKSFGLVELSGKIWIADFIFTTCPGPCPIISTRMAELQKPLEKTDIQLVSMTVDPERDTPAVLRA